MNLKPTLDLPLFCFRQGMPGAPGMKVYSREDIEKYKDNPGKFGNEDEDDSDEEEDEKFPKNLVLN